MDTSSFEIISVLFGLLSASGLLSLVLKYKTRLSLLELRASSTEGRQIEMEQKQDEMDKAVAVIQSQLPDLHDLKRAVDAASIKIDQLKEAWVQSVTRPEQNARWENMDRRVAAVEEALKRIDT